MNIGIYGGSFNPVHYGHLGLAHYVLAHTPLDALWLMVTPSNPLKSARNADSSLSRLAQVKAAVAESLQSQPLPAGKQLVVSDFEFSLPLPNYTAQTLRALHAAYPQHNFSLVIGEDNWHIFSRWRDWQYILSNHHIYIYPRRNTAVADAPALDIPTCAGHVHFLVGAPLFDISSTEIRRRQNENAE